MAEEVQTNMTKQLRLCLQDVPSLEWVMEQHQKGECDVPIGPLCEIIPVRYHTFIPKGILKSLVCEDEKSAAKIRMKIGVADIPVITSKYTEDIYDHITTNLTDTGKDALQEIHPWIIKILIDWANFDQIICTCPLGEGKTIQDIDVHDENNNNEENDLKETDSDHDKHNRADVAGSSKVQISKSTAMDKTASCTSIKTWKPEDVKKLIDVKVQNDFRFNKPGTKKKSIWQNIAEEINKDGSAFTYQQCEQKWKNLTKIFRDTVDHNQKSGNDVKKCPYFTEMEEAYGYKANVKPIFTMSSSMPSAETVTCEDSDVESLNESSLAEEGKRKKKASDSDPTNNQATNNQGKKVKKSNEVLMFLETMNEEFKEEQKGLLSEIKEQHKAKMDKEDQKIQLMSQIIEHMKK